MDGNGAEKTQPDVIMLYDGQCNFCSGSALFVLRRSPGPAPKFCAMQSDRGQSFLKQLNMPVSDFETFALVDGERHFVKSDAIVRLSKYMVAPWPLLGSMFAVLPKSWRDGLYNVVATNRYRLLGRRETCMIPDPDVRKRFLE